MLVTRIRQPAAIRTACVTVLFADLRGYTGMVERLPAARVVPLLDEFFAALGAAAQQFGGKGAGAAADGFRKSRCEIANARQLGVFATRLSGTKWAAVMHPAQSSQSPISCAASSVRR